MSTSALRLVWLCILLGLPLLHAAAPVSDDLAALDPPSARADDGDEEDPDGEGEEEGEDDFFDTPTTFTKEQVEKAILKGVTWLKKHQRDDGSWGEIRGEQLYGGDRVRAIRTPPGRPRS